MGKQRQQRADLTPFHAASSITAQVPAVCLWDPRYPHNVGAAVRGASCYGIKQVWVGGRRTAEKVWESKRLPREERMKGFNDVEIVLEDNPFDHFPKGTTPVAVELLPGSTNLFQFEHPENPVYVFGPEDGSVPDRWRRHCHQRVFIPTKHCLNLGVAVNTLLYDRYMKMFLNGEAEALPMEVMLAEDRGRLMGWPIEDDPEFT